MAKIQTRMTCPKCQKGKLIAYGNRGLNQGGSCGIYFGCSEIYCVIGPFEQMKIRQSFSTWMLKQIQNDLIILAEQERLKRENQDKLNKEMRDLNDKLRDKRKKDEFLHAAADWLLSGQDKDNIQGDEWKEDIKEGRGITNPYLSPMDNLRDKFMKTWDFGGMKFSVPKDV